MPVSTLRVKKKSPSDETIRLWLSVKSARTSRKQTASPLGETSELMKLYHGVYQQVKWAQLSLQMSQARV